MAAAPPTTPPRPPPPPIPRRHPSRSVSGASCSLATSPLTFPASPDNSANTCPATATPPTAVREGRGHPSTPGGGAFTPVTPSHSSSGASAAPSATPSSVLLPPPNNNNNAAAAAAANGTSHARPPSSILLGAIHTPARSASPNAQHQQHRPASPGMLLGSGALGLGGAASAVGLGPVRIDFKDWVKAGRDGGGGGNGTSSAMGTADDGEQGGRDGNDEQDANAMFRDADEGATGARSPIGLGGESSRGAASTSSRAPGHSNDRPVTSPVPFAPPSSLQRAKIASTLPASNSFGSLSIDSNYSPQSILGQASPRKDRPTLTPRRPSQDMSREKSSASIGSRSSRYRYSLPPTPLGAQSPPSAPGVTSPTRYPPEQQPQQPARDVTSPLESRFSRRIMSQRDSSAGLATEAVDEEAAEPTPKRPEQSVDDRIREAEEHLARRASLRNGTSGDHSSPRRSTVWPARQFDSVRTSSRRQNPLSPVKRPEATANGGGVATPVDSSGAEYDSGSRESRESGERGGSGSRLGKVRPSIPAEFHNGRLVSGGDKLDTTILTSQFSPPPAAKPEEHYREAHLRHQVDLNDSPRSQRVYTARPASVLEHRESPRWSGGNGRSSTMGTSRLSRDFDSLHSPLGGRNRPGSVLETSADHDRYRSHGYYNSPHRHNTYHPDSSAASRMDALMNEFGVRTPGGGERNGSERGYRRSRDYGTERSSRDFGAYHGGGPPNELRPSDSASMAGTRCDFGGGASTVGHSTPNKNPLDVLRRLEEARTQSNGQWEERRSASVLGDRSTSVLGDRSASALGDPLRYGEREVLASTRPSSRIEDGTHQSSSRVRPQTSMSSMSSVRDNLASNMSAPRTAPMPRRRTDSTDDSVLESPLLGRSRSRASGTFPASEPRVRLRSQTSIGGRSQGSSSANELTEHGRNLADASRALGARKADMDPEVIAKLAAAAKGAERANTGVRAAAAILAELAIDVEVDTEAATAMVRERLPRISVTLREAGRSSDEAVRDLTDALLAVRLAAGSSASSSVAPTTATPSRAALSRRPESMYTPRDTNETSHRRGWSTTAHESPRNDPRHSPSLSTISITHSPLMRYNGRDLRAERPPSASGRYDTPPSRNYDHGHGHGTPSRYDAPRSLDPIEQSPPKPAAINHPGSPAPLDGGLGISHTNDDRDRERRVARSSVVLHDAVSPTASTTTVTARGAVSSPTTAWPGSGAMMSSPRHSWQYATKSSVTTDSSSDLSSWRAGSPLAGERGDEHNLRKQSSLASTNTVRPHSFGPSHPAEPTTAVSSSPAYSRNSLSLSQSSAAQVQATLSALDGNLSLSRTRTVSSSDKSANACAVVEPREQEHENGNGGHQKTDSTHSSISLHHDGPSPVIATGPAEVTRMGTFGSARSVSERFRKHLSGE